MIKCRDLHMSGNSHSKVSPKANHLITEKSPYLLQHAHNPVDWYPWGEEAFRKAKTENKPIFLSIGYSSCHWCHVMAHESFEDENVAKFLNDNFVSIKVDREERPDVDEIYMKSVISTTGSGGWPLSVFLTPSLEPFFGGTYFPASPRYGMPSFMNLLKEISRSWKTERKNLVDTATQIRNELKKMYEIGRIANSDLNDSVFHDCYGELASSFDENYGGFGLSPKFPMPTNLLFLLRYSLLRPSSSALRMATKTLDSMMRGGIYDQVGGGFHRYSTDRYWIVPHFEKMLYDNALLSLVYCEAFQITKKEEYARIVKETLEWVLREMSSQEGGFYSAQDADSPEGEGAYYLWDLDEVQTCLKTEIGSPELISDFFSITSQGNFENGKSILTAKQSSSFAENHGLLKDEIDKMIQASKEMMLVRRNMRPKPSTDDKILTSWNGLMISALSKAYCVTGTKKYLEAATHAAEFVLNKLAILVDGKMKILRSYRDGESKGEGVLEDYSYFIIGLIDLFEACYDPKYLETAVFLCESMLYRFHDKQGGAFFMTDGSSTNLIVRPKDAYDGATPSGNSMAALASVKLSEFTARKDFEDAARDIFVTFWSVISSQPSSFTEMLVALQFFLGERKEIVISGDSEARDAKELIRTLRSVFLPNSITVLADERLQHVTPLVHERVAKKGERARAYVCSNFSCKMPISSPEQLMDALRE